MKRYTPQEVLEHGKKLIAEAHDEYVSLLKQGYMEDDAYWTAWDGVGTSNFDDIAIIWAAGAVRLALRSKAVMEAIEEGICLG